MFIPRGGFAVDIEALEDLGVPRDEARIRVLGLGSLEYAVLATGALICAIFLLIDHSDAQRAVTLSWTIGVPAGTALALIAVHYRKWICRGRLSGILGPPLEAIAVVGQIVASPRRHGAAAFTGMAVYWAGEVFVLWVCLAAFDRVTPSVAAVVVGYATGYALDAPDAPARRRRRRRGAPAVRAPLGRVQLARRRPRRLRLPGLQPLAATRPGGVRALPPAAASARRRRAASA